MQCIYLTGKTGKEMSKAHCVEIFVIASVTAVPYYSWAAINKNIHDSIEPAIKEGPQEEENEVQHYPNLLRNSWILFGKEYTWKATRKLKQPNPLPKKLMVDIEGQIKRRLWYSMMAIY